MKVKVLLLFSWFSRVILSLLFIVSGISKIKQPYDFLDQVLKYQIVGASGSILIASILPWVEICVGTCLLSGLLLKTASVWTIGLGLLFTGAQISALIRGLENDCGCFGGHKHMETIGAFTVTRAIVVVLLGALILFCHRFSSEHPTHLSAV